MGMAADKYAKTTGTVLWGWQSKIRTIAERGKHILGTDILSDVTFRVGPKDGGTVDIKAHRFILAMGSAVFETMFYGNLPERRSIIPITDMGPGPFKILLRYLYHDQIGPFDHNTAFPTLYAAKKYGLPILGDACAGYLRANVTSKNCLAWLVQAQTYDEPKLAEFFLSTIDSMGPLVLTSADFLEVDLTTVKQILSRDSLNVREVDVFDAAVKWANRRCAYEKIDRTGVNLRAALGDALFLIRFPIMTSQEVASGPAMLGILLAEEVNQLFQFWYGNETLPRNFISSKRHISAEFHIARFGGKQDGWTYAAGRPNRIKLCITSVTDKASRNVDLACISLVAVGFYLSSEQISAVLRPVYNHSVKEGCPSNGYTFFCLCGEPYRHQYGQYCAYSRSTDCCTCPQTDPQSSRPKPSLTISLKVYVEDGAKQKELKEFRQKLYPPSGETGDGVQKIALSKIVPVKIRQRYTVSADIMGIRKSYYGTEGKGSVTKATSSGDFNVTVQFSSVPEANGNQALVTSNRTVTTAAQGQLPEFYFEGIG